MEKDILISEKKEMIKAEYKNIENFPSHVFTNWEQGYIACCGETDDDRLEMIQCLSRRALGKLNL